MSKKALACIALSGLLACKSVPAPAVAHPVAPSVPARAWQSTLDVKHPLVGSFWDVSRGVFVDEAYVARAASGAKFVLLGERHDNADHHAMQLSILKAVVQSGRKPSVAFEMFDTGDQPAIAAVSADRAEGKTRGVDALAEAVKWDKKGWPAWGMYSPLVETALDANLVVLAANLPRAEMKTIVRDGLAVGMEAGRIARLGLDKPLPPAQEAALREELVRDHCGMLPPNTIANFAVAQRARDALMAERMLSGGSGSVLIAGAGHVRKDRGVPYALASQEPGARTVSLGMVEVDHAKTKPEEYTDLPFDFVWFTPRVTDEDPCAEMREQMKRAHEKR